jgi:hypothetical protein
MDGWTLLLVRTTDFDHVVRGPETHFTSFIGRRRLIQADASRGAHSLIRTMGDGMIRTSKAGALLKVMLAQDMGIRVSEIKSGTRLHGSVDS